MELLPIDYIGGFFDGEGCVTISSHMRGNRGRKKTLELTPSIVITQKNPLILIKIQESLSSLGIDTLLYIPENQAARIRINRIEMVLKFCELMIPFTVCKQQELKLMKEYCEHRLSQKINATNSKPYTKIDFAYVENLRELK